MVGDRLITLEHAEVLFVQAGQILTVLLRKSPTTENTDETTRSARIAEPQIAAPERSVTAGLFVAGLQRDHNAGRPQTSSDAQT